VRHNTDEHLLGRNRNAIFVNRMVNSIAPKIIAPSEKVYKYITEVEKISPRKITRINYGYNFNQYLETDKTGQAKSIRQQFPARLLLVSVARLIPAKRHLLMFEAISVLLKQGYDIRLICIGSGPLKESLEDHLTKNNLTEKIFLPGPKTNVFDYLEAADVFLHLSETEASNSAVKEAGYCRKPVIVCPDVGDFSDYVQHGVNGFLVKKDDPVPETVEAISFLYNNPGTIDTMGQKLFETVTEEFSINKVAGLYEKILGNET
jgi:glycosyltransferase involved in cell wall biosynthesis